MTATIDTTDLRLGYCREIVGMCTELDKLGRPSATYVAQAHEAMAMNRPLSDICAIRDHVATILASERDEARLWTRVRDRVSDWWNETGAEAAGSLLYFAAFMVGLALWAMSLA